jgi:hypothetical protein
MTFRVKGGDGGEVTASKRGRCGEFKTKLIQIG